MYHGVTPASKLQISKKQLDFMRKRAFWPLLLLHTQTFCTKTNKERRRLIWCSHLQLQVPMKQVIPLHQQQLGSKSSGNLYSGGQRKRCPPPLILICLVFSIRPLWAFMSARQILFNQLKKETMICTVHCNCMQVYMNSQCIFIPYKKIILRMNTMRLYPKLYLYC